MRAGPSRSPRTPPRRAWSSTRTRCARSTTRSAALAATSLGVAILGAWQPENESRAPSRGLLRRVAGLFGAYRGRLALLSGAILLSSGLGVVNPLLTKVVFDSALFPEGGGDPNVRLLVFLVVVMLLTGALSSAIGVGQTYIASVLGQRVMQDLRNRLYSHLQAMSLRFFTSTRTGEIQSRLQNDVAGIQTVVTDTASTILANIVIIASSLVAMAVLSWQLTLLSLVVVPLFVYLTYRVGRIRRKLRKETQESLAEMSALTEETLSVSGVLLTKVFARTGDAVERYRRENQRLADLQVRQQMVGRTFFALVGTFFSFAPALVYLVSGLAIYYGVGPAISAGTIVAFTALQTRLFFPIGSMLQVSTEIQSSLALFERIFQYLDLPHEIVDRPGARHARSGRDPRPGVLPGRVVRVRQPGGGGRSTATSARPAAGRSSTSTSRSSPASSPRSSGASGAGKTTITYLIPRLYEATDGVVAIDGIDVKDIALGSLAEAVGMVTQETYLFHASVRENLLYARPDATDEQIERAARAALIHDRILELEDGYDTRVGERGYRMSGRREAAARDRARAAQGPAHPRARRGDLGARHDERAARPARARAADGGPHDDRDRPPALDDRRRRRDLRRRPRPDRRARLARGAAGEARRVRDAVRGAVRGRARGGALRGRGRAARRRAGGARAVRGFGLPRGARDDGTVVPRWVALGFLVLTVGLVPWTIWLFFSLPDDHLAQNWCARVGRVRRRRWASRSALTSVSLLPARRGPGSRAAVAGTLLVCDAWFDITTSRGTDERLQAIGLAVVVELPLAAVCFWIARNIERVRPTPARTCSGSASGSATGGSSRRRRSSPIAGARRSRAPRR